MGELSRQEESEEVKLIKRKAGLIKFHLPVFLTGVLVGFVTFVSTSPGRSQNTRRCIGNF